MEWSDHLRAQAVKKYHQAMRLSSLCMPHKPGKEGETWLPRVNVPPDPMASQRTGQKRDEVKV